MTNDENKTKIKRVFKANALYLVMGLCLLGAGIAGISSAGNSTISKTQEDTTKSYDNLIIPEVTTAKSSKDNSVEIEIDEFTVQTEPSTAAVFDNNAQKVAEDETQAAPVIFYSPVSLNIGKDYSMGLPVFSQTMNDYRTHNGVDFTGVKGENVKTTGEGTVVSVTKDAVWGNTVTIDHKNGITSSISGLADEALISTGAEVYTGTIIGIIGEIPIESSDAPHVHLEMRANGQLVDPLEILGLSGE